jgi:hypothetical protein
MSLKSNFTQLTVNKFIPVANTAIVITEHLRIPEVIRVIYAEEFTKAV